MSLEGLDSASPQATELEEEGMVMENVAIPGRGSRSQTSDGSETGGDDGLLGLNPTQRGDMDALIKQALSGTLPRERSLKSWEPNKLNPAHIEMIFMRACGLRPGRIAEIMGYDSSTVSVVLNHPDARTILSKVMSYAADEVIDIDTRLQGMLGEAVDTLAGVMRSGKEENRMKVAFGILDRKGYGKETKVKTTHEIMVPEKHMGLLSAALQESQQLRNIGEADYVIVEQPAPPIDQPGSVREGSEAGRTPSGVTDTDVPPVSGSQADTANSGISKLEKLGVKLPKRVVEPGDEEDDQPRLRRYA